MAGTAKRTDPDLWERVKSEVTRGEKGGEPGQWSARKAQLAVAQYKKAGGGYAGAKTADNHLAQWTREEWGTKSGRASGETGERYLPKRARESLTDAEYARSTARKRRDTAAGEQFSAQPKDVADKTAAARRGASRPAASAKAAEPAAAGAPAKSAGEAASRPAARSAAKRGRTSSGSADR